MLTIRKARVEDLGTITEIYNEAILQTVSTFDTQPKTIKEQTTWFADHDAKHPILVADCDGHVAGWASLSKWSDRCAYSDTAEVSLYVKKEHRGRGIGRKLMKALIEEGQKNSLHTLIVRISESNEPSIKLFKDEGFELVGVMKEVGRKFGRLLDVYMMQKILDK
ncbi:MAG TPA: GNAT family N-acetyltransferase [Candidatus Bathyarchaeia archaeon]